MLVEHSGLKIEGNIVQIRQRPFNIMEFAILCDDDGNSLSCGKNLVKGGGNA